jgi:hypothetical protein
VVNNYRNARFVNGRNGVTSVNASDFGRGRNINSNNFVRASNNDLARAGSVQGRLPFTASSDARHMSDRRVNAQAMPQVNNSTRFAQRTSGQRAPQAASQGFSQGQGRQAQVVGGNNGGNGGGNNTPQRNGGGWRTFEGGRSNEGNRSNSPAQTTPAPQMRNFPQQQQQQPRQQQQQQAIRETPRQQPVRISPPIVRERAPSPQASRPEPARGGFGAPRAQSGGGGGGQPQPHNNGGGGGQSRGGGGGGGGGNRGGGNGGGHDRR